MARDSLALSDPGSVSGPPARPRRRRRGAPSTPPVEESSEDAGDDEEEGAAPIARVRRADDDDDHDGSEDDGDDGDDAVDDDAARAASAPPAPARARRRKPRLDPGSHVDRAKEDDDDDGVDATAAPEPVTAPEKPSKAKKAAKAKKATKPKRASATVITTSITMDILGIGACALGLLVLLALLSYSSTDAALGPGRPVKNWIGPGGALVADLLTLTLGLVAFAVPGALFVVGWSCFRPHRFPVLSLRGAGALAALLGGMALLHLLFRGSTWLPYPGGGLLGALLFDGGSRLLAPVGTSIVALALFLVGGLVALDRPLGKTVLSLGEKARVAWTKYLERAQVWREEQRLLREERDALLAEVDVEAEDAARKAEEAERAERVKAEAKKRARVKIVEIAAAAEAAPPVDEAPTDPGVRPGADPAWAASAVGAAPVLPGPAAVDEKPPVPFAPAVYDDASAIEPADDEGGLKIVERALPDAATILAAAEAAVSEPPVAKTDYVLPPLNLLDYDAPQVEPIDEELFHQQAQKLVQKFKDFGIEGRIREIRPGPVVTTYEFVPAPGIKVSKIAALSDDIAMAMEAVHVRIVAPIPGKGAVGIELPNAKRETVFMKEIIADPAFKKKDDKLIMALGKDIEGRPTYANLAEMPHLLIAGTTGSGKSVSVNAMICSLLYRATPDDVKFLMIDPKMLELSIYEGIPHLLLPPIIDSKKAANALKWAVGEMERRYQSMSELGVRDIAGYNEKNPTTKLPFIVIIIDEYADLLAVAGKDVEAYVMRLAQKARAAGIHVMLATQRPSVDVITGVIKANFPVRMGFRLASNHDSKTVINRPGAEKLLGRGDMLFMPPGTSNVQRVHGAYISEKELHRVVDYLKAQGKPTYDMSILAPPPDEEGEAAGGGDEDKDERYEDAVNVVARTRKCSTSWLQRQLGIGYNRAARIVEMMERQGLVGPVQNAKGDREIFIPPAK